MQKKTRRVKKVRRIVKWKPVLWLFVVINVFIGILYSPITSVRRIRVVGANPYDHDRIIQHLQIVRKVPYVKIDCRRIETLILANDEIKDASVRLNPFGRGYMRIIPRQAVAKISNTPLLYLCEDGFLFRSRTCSAGRLAVRLVPVLGKLNMGFGGYWEARRVADLCKKFAKIMPFGAWNVEVDTRGVICLNSSSGTKIILGSGSDLDEKYLK